jgi:hypothetical protein
VDAMVADNNDDIKEQLKRIEQNQAKIEKEIEKLMNDGMMK